MTSHKINIGKAVYSVKQHENGTFTAYNCSTLREVKSENTMHKILKALAERDHAEALEMNAETDRRRHLSVMASIQNTIMERDDLPALVEACHAEALEMDDELNHSKSKAEMEESAISINPTDLAQRALAFRLDYTPEGRERRIREAHTEALEINEAIDSMIAARQHIANKKPDFSQETWDLVRLGNSYKEAGREWYRWAKATALRLWENRLTQRQLFQMQ
ncbi:hypothetical protein [Enterobacter cloacae]|uniref:hypothetical protein n=1 Tax=Enterobacter cloacae TaxID=550 RepID=UPI002175831B|nr:hypothetical protein [Enterobacter cloacae]UWA67266.1 hypothetical protein M5S62_08815 [Enterobacter cloacae]